jgi:hypothetical protein
VLIISFFAEQDKFYLILGFLCEIKNLDQKFKLFEIRYLKIVMLLNQKIKSCNKSDIGKNVPKHVTNKLSTLQLIDE